MLCSCQNGVSRLARLTPALAVVSASAWLFLQTSQAASPDPLVPAIPESVPGPTNVALGEVATLKVPVGYAFFGAQGARTLLQAANSPVPKGVCGMMQAIYNGGWTVVFSYEETGYIQDPQPAQINQDAILKRARAQKEIANPAWVMAPTYNAAENKLEWAIQAESATKVSSKVQNYTTWFLGREGILKATTIYAGYTDPDALKTLLSGVSFKAGKGYGAHQAGDKLAQASLAQLAQEEDTEVAAAPKLGASGLDYRTIGTWIGIFVMAALGIVALVFAVGKLVKLIGKMRAQVAMDYGSAPVSRAAVPAPPAAAETTAADEEPKAPLTAHGANGFQPKLTPTPTQPGKRNGRLPRRLNGYAKARRKEFDYNRYFADLMSTVSSHGLALESARNNALALQMPQVPVVTVPETNGNGHVPVPYHANSEMIANQTTLIEEQRRLIQEQAKLIEEKSKLIAEKNQLLQIQRELFE